MMTPSLARGGRLVLCFLCVLLCLSACEWGAPVSPPAYTPPEPKPEPPTPTEAYRIACLAYEDGFSHIIARTTLSTEGGAAVDIYLEQQTAGADRRLHLRQSADGPVRNAYLWYVDGTAYFDTPAGRGCRPADEEELAAVYPARLADPAALAPTEEELRDIRLETEWGRYAFTLLRAPGAGADAFLRGVLGADGFRLYQKGSVDQISYTLRFDEKGQFLSTLVVFELVLDGQTVYVQTAVRYAQEAQTVSLPEAVADFPAADALLPI